VQVGWIQWGWIGVELKEHRKERNWEHIAGEHIAGEQIARGRKPRVRMSREHITREHIKRGSIVGLGEHMTFTSIGDRRLWMQRGVEA
jgi:hypothetical protein